MATKTRSTSVVRAMRILEWLSWAEKPMALTRIAEALEIPKSTAHSILRDLASEDFVEISEPPAYSVGLKAFEVGSAHLRVIGVAGVVAAELVRLTNVLNVTSHYAVLDRGDVVYLCKQDPPGLGIHLASSIGARLPAHVTAVGKSSLAWLDPDQVTRCIELGGAARTELDADLELVRARGYSTDDGATSVGIRCVAAPIFDLSGPRGAVGVSYLRDNGSSFDAIVAEVRNAAARATSLLGGRASS